MRCMAERWYSSGIPTCFSAIGRYMYISASVCESRTTSGKLLDTTFRCVYFVFASPINAHLSHLKYTVVNHFILYRGTSLIRNIPILGPYSRTSPRVLWWS